MRTSKIRFIVELPNAHVIYMTSNLAIFTHVQDVRTMQNARAGRLSNYVCKLNSSKAFVLLFDVFSSSTTWDHQVSRIKGK